MNERIKELAKWAGYNGHYATEEFDVDAFARLIVLECANIDFRHKVGMTTDQDFDTSRAIMEHFGTDSK